MDNIVVDINKEMEDVVNEVVSLYGYNDDMKTVLQGITRAVVDGRSYEDRQIFYDVLRTTPIVVLDQNTQVTSDELHEKMFGEINQHIKEKDTFDKGEYGKQSLRGGGGFSTTPIFDEDLNITGVKKFIYVDSFDTSKKLYDMNKEFYERFQTGISVPHLIHELGHAYAAARNPYSVEKKETGETIVTQRMGACSIKQVLTPMGDGTYESEQISMDGLFIEEGLNSNFEEDTLAKYLGVSLEEAKKLYNVALPASHYQPRISNMIRLLSESGFKDDLDKWRMTGDSKSLDRINEILSKANYYEKRSKLFERIHEDIGDHESEVIPARNYVFNHPDNERLAEVLSKIEEDFFPDTENMTPMDMMNNILLQYYDVTVNKYSFPIDTYGKMLSVIQAEGGAVITQALDKQKEENNENRTVEEQ